MCDNYSSSAQLVQAQRFGLGPRLLAYSLHRWVDIVLLQLETACLWLVGEHHGQCYHLQFTSLIQVICKCCRLPLMLTLLITCSTPTHPLLGSMVHFCVPITWSLDQSCEHARAESLVVKYHVDCRLLNRWYCQWHTRGEHIYLSFKTANQMKMGRSFTSRNNEFSTQLMPWIEYYLSLEVPFRRTCPSRLPMTCGCSTLVNMFCGTETLT